MKKLILLITSLGLTVMINAQNVSDALRYSSLAPLGSARSVGVAGSMGAIGGDFGSISDNPAGLAGYHFSEIVFSPVFYINQVSSRLGTTSNFSRENFYNSGVDNLGLVIVRNGYEGAKWRTVNFSIGFNKLADFNKQLYFDGASTGSITDHWREQAANIIPDNLSNFSSGLAYETGAIYDADNNNIYESDFISFANKPVAKNQLVKARGYMSELTFAMAGNYNDHLLIGGAIGIPMVSYRENKSYRESDPNNENPVFESLEYEENLKTTGSGVNLKLGAILKLHDIFRIGLSFQTPTLFELDDEYTTALTYSYVDKGKVESYNKQSPDLGLYTYNLITPLRAKASFGSVIAKNGFIGASIEYVNYAQAQFDFDNEQSTSADIEYQNELNDEVERQYKGTFNYSVGAEIAFDALRLRGGVNLMGSPYDNDTDLTQTISAGIGYRGGRFFTDLAIRHTRYDDGYLPYTTVSNDPQQVYNKHQQNRLVFTVGYKF